MTFPLGQHFTIFGLFSVDPINIGRNCDEVVCDYGAECEEDGNRAGCVCNMQCSDMEDNEVYT